MDVEYKPYTPWDELEKLKSKHMFDNVKVEDCPSQIRVKDNEFEISRTTPDRPFDSFGY